MEMDWSSSGSGENECILAEQFDRKVLNTLPATLVSSILSMIGSLLIVVSFLAWKEVRVSYARRILFLLAVADLFTAAAFFSAVVSHYVFMKKNDTIAIRKNKDYIEFCRWQAFFSVYFQDVSFFLTAYLAVYFFIVLVCNKPKLARKLALPFCLTAWGLPLLVCGYVLSRNKFGIGDSRSSVGWCFIDNTFLKGKNMTESKHHTHVVLYFLYEAVSEKAWEILTLFVIVGCYIPILCLNRCKYKKKYSLRVRKDSDDGASQSLVVSEDDPGQWNTHHAISRTNKQSTPPASPIKGEWHVVKALSKADLKLALIPLVFLLFRFWGTFRFFVSMISGCHLYKEQTESFFCIDEDCYRILYNQALLFLHAFGDPAQGFGNGILFVFLSKPIFKRFFGPLVRCLGRNRCCCKPSLTADVRSDVNTTPEDNDKAPRVIVTYRTSKSQKTLKQNDSQSTTTTTRVKAIHSKESKS